MSFGISISVTPVVGWRKIDRKLGDEADLARVSATEVSVEIEASQYAAAGSELFVADGIANTRRSAGTTRPAVLRDGRERTSPDRCRPSVPAWPVVDHAAQIRSVAAVCGFMACTRSG